MGVQPSPGGALERSQESSLADVVNTILDKGVVVDVFARVSLVGIELVRADVRIVIASIDTYLRFAEHVGRLDMGSEEPSDLTELPGKLTEGVSKGKTKGALAAGAEQLQDLVGTSDRKEKDAPKSKDKGMLEAGAEKLQDLLGGGEDEPAKRPRRRSRR